jgi:hypothetical protein
MCRACTTAARDCLGTWRSPIWYEEWVADGSSDATARIVLREEVTRDDLFAAREANGWLLANSLPVTTGPPSSSS